MEEGALTLGLAEWGQAEGQRHKGTEAGKSAGGLGVVSGLNMRMESKGRGWRRRLEPGPEGLGNLGEGSDKQEGAPDGS